MRPSRTATRLAILAGLAAFAAAVPSLPAGAADGSSSVNCATGSSCEIMLEHMVHFGGKNYSPGAENTVVDITPPPCLWIPQGDAHTGSQYVIDFYNNTDPGPGALFDGRARLPRGQATGRPEPDTRRDLVRAAGQPERHPGPGAAVPERAAVLLGRARPALPGIQIPPQTLAQLALAKMNVPQAGQMILSPSTGNSYSNLPTFARTTLSFRPEFGANGMPYVTDNAQLGDQSATVWVRATPLQLSTSDNSARLDTAGCGYLGSTRDGPPTRAQVAHTGANGTADCGVTFRQPGTWNITATLTWQACWAVGVDAGPPPADCNPVPGAALNPVNWARNVNVREIQASNGGG